MTATIQSTKLTVTDIWTIIA